MTSKAYGIKGFLLTGYVDLHQTSFPLVSFFDGSIVPKTPIWEARAGAGE